MDNLIQIIIFLFIIYFLFGSVFGKKKQQGTGGNVPDNSEGEEQQKSSPSSSPEDLLEMFGFKIPKTGGEYEQPRTTIPTADRRTRFEQMQQPETTSEFIPPTPMDSAKEDKEFAERTKVYDTPRTINERANSIKQKIKSPSSLRELILVSEILKKPKAHRS